MDSPSVKVLKETNSSLSMEVVIAEASTPKRPLRESDAAKSPCLTAVDIKRKLDDAAERRRSLTQDRQQSIATRLAKIEEVHSNKSTKHDEFIKATKEALEQKMDVVGEKREAILNQLKEKVKERLDKIQELQQCKENDEQQQTKVLQAAIEEKLNQATANREKNLGEIKQRLQEHEEAVAKASNYQKEQLEALREKINQQLATAAERREENLQKIVEAAKKEEEKIEMVRQKKEAMANNGCVDMDIEMN